MFNLFFGKNLLDDYIKMYFLAPTFSILVAYLMWFTLNHDSFYKYKINPNYSDCETIKNEIDLGLHSFIFASINAALFAFFYVKKKTKINLHFEFSFKFIFSTVCKMLFLLICTDTIQAIFHNSFHRFSYLKKDHLKHHSYDNPTPFTLYANAELELFMLTSGLILFSRTFKMNIFFYLSVHIFNILFGLYIHSGYYIFRNKWLMTSLHHYSHHDKEYSKCPYGHNRGFLFKFSDQILSTLVNPKFTPNLKNPRKDFKNVNNEIKNYLIKKVSFKFYQMCSFIIIKIIIVKLTRNYNRNIN